MVNIDNLALQTTATLIITCSHAILSETIKQKVAQMFGIGNVLIHLHKKGTKLMKTDRFTIHFQSPANLGSCIMCERNTELDNK